MYTGPRPNRAVAQSRKERHLRWSTSVLAAVVVLTLPLAVSSARGQSLTAGAIMGTVKDTTGRPLSRVRVEVSEPTGGFTRSQVTGRDGRYAFTFLSAGEYVVLAEALGYRPVEIRGVRVTAGAELETEARLVPAEPPVMERTVVLDERRALAASEGATGWTLGRLELFRLPDEGRDLASAARFTSIADDDLVIEGLPSHLTRVTVEGIPFRILRHPVSGQPDLPTLAFPVSGVAAGGIQTDGLDVEWAGFAGGRLDVTERRGGSRPEVRLFGDWSGPALTRSKYYAPGDLSGNSIRAGFQVSGPVIRDTAHFMINVEGRRLETPYPRGWEVTAVDSALVAAAADSFGVDLNPRLAPSIAETKAVAGSGRFDWQPTTGNRLAVFAHGGILEGTSLPVAGNRFPSSGSRVEGTDVAAGAVLTSVLSPGFAMELRGSFETSRRVFTVPDGGLTVVPAGPVSFGADPALSGTFRQSGFRLVQTLHLTQAAHRLKVGGGGGIRSWRSEYVAGRTGTFVFGGADQLASANGAFSQTVGPPPLARFTGVEAGGFVQDRWHVAPGLAILLGVRLDWEKVPTDEVLPDTAWLVQTGMRNDSLKGGRIKLSPRGGFTWDVANQHRWFVRGGGGMYHDVVDGAVLGEAIATAPATEGRRGVGALGRWPVPPDSSAAPVQGGAFAILHPGASAPRSTRASFGVSGILGGGVVLHLGTAYRHTDFLVRRHDLNLLPVPAARDQYGRPVYGTLVQDGAALAATPGSNRRFPTFDAVTALDQDGYSDYVGFTARLERRVGRGLTLSTGYTFSRTEDNWLGARGTPEQQVTPFPDSLSGRDWADGRSDFDVPHRFVFGAELDFGSVRLAGFYGYRSGDPFTPGFRDGVDANADGSWRNDPAYVDDQVTGVGDLFAAWPCLREQVGRFAERNSCRGPTVQRLDLRLVLGPFRLGYPIEVTVDALNVLDAEYAAVDRAVYLVDPAGALTTDAATGVVTVPLLANPSFGTVVRRLGSGRALRLGIRVNYE